MRGWADRVRLLVGRLRDSGYRFGVVAERRFGYTGSVRPSILFAAAGAARPLPRPEVAWQLVLLDNHVSDERSKSKDPA